MDKNAPAVIVLFGATGDLTQRKLIPALYNLFRNQQLPSMLQIIGFARRDWSNTFFQEQMRIAIQTHVLTIHQDHQTIESFLKLLSYTQGNFDSPEGFQKLAKQLGYINGTWEVCSHRLFYLSTPPSYYKTIISHLKQTGLSEPCTPDKGDNKILVEKPFGRDLQTAQELDEFIGQHFDEHQVFRIDHYLTKQSVLNLLAFRFSNPIFSPIWSKQYIQSVHIQMLEDLGMEGRGPLYDDIGALRDVGQNHILQMLSFITMDNPGSFSSDSIREKRHEIMKTLQNIPEDDINKYTIRAQYQGYTNEDGVSPDSQTETYFKIKSYLDHPNWQGVPFMLESGKRMSETKIQIHIEFKPMGQSLFPPQDRPYFNRLTFRIQPNEGVELCFWVKKPGLDMQLDLKTLEFNYQTGFQDQQLPGAYEKVLLDAISGDQTLFATTSELIDSWDFITGINQVWQAGKAPLYTYEPGSWGPHEAQELACE